MQQFRVWIARDPNTAFIVVLVVGLVVGGFIGFAAGSGGGDDEAIARLNANWDSARADAEEYKAERDQARSERDSALAEAEMWRSRAREARRAAEPEPVAEPEPEPEPEPKPATIVEQEIVNEGSPLEAARISLVAPDDPRGAVKECAEGIDSPNGGFCWAFPSEQAFREDSACWTFMATREEAGGAISVDRQSEGARLLCES